VPNLISSRPTSACATDKNSLDTEHGIGLFLPHQMNHNATTSFAAALGLSAIVVSVVSATRAPRGF